MKQRRRIHIVVVAGVQVKMSVFHRGEFVKLNNRYQAYSIGITVILLGWGSDSVDTVP